MADETPEGRPIVVLAKEKYGIRARDMASLNATFVPFTAQTRMSGIDYNGISIRKGAVDSVLAQADMATRQSGALRVNDTASKELVALADAVARSGGTPLAVMRDGQLRAWCT